MVIKDPYSVLGVAPNTSPEELRSKYRKLLNKNHPDRGGDAATFDLIIKAYAQITKEVCPDCGGTGIVKKVSNGLVTKSVCHKCWNK